LEDAPDRAVQRLCQPAQLGLKRPAGAAQFPDGAAKRDLALGDIGPIHLPRGDLGPIKTALLNLILADRIIAQCAHGFGVVHAQTGALVRKPENRAIHAHNPPGMTHQR